MDCRCDVSILVQEKAFELLKNAMDEVNKKTSVTFKPDSIKTGTDETIGTFYLLKWNFIKWQSENEGVAAIETALSNLCKEHENEAGYGFKIVKLDNNFSESTNNDIVDYLLYPISHIVLDTKSVLEEWRN